MPRWPVRLQRRDHGCRSRSQPSPPGHAASGRMPASAPFCHCRVWQPSPNASLSGYGANHCLRQANGLSRHQVFRATGLLKPVIDQTEGISQRAVQFFRRSTIRCDSRVDVVARYSGPIRWVNTFVLTLLCVARRVVNEAPCATHPRHARRPVSVLSVDRRAVLLTGGAVRDITDRTACRPHLNRGRFGRMA